MAVSSIQPVVPAIVEARLPASRALRLPSWCRSMTGLMVLGAGSGVALSFRHLITATPSSCARLYVPSSIRADQIRRAGVSRWKSPEIPSRAHHQNSNMEIPRGRKRLTARYKKGKISTREKLAWTLTIPRI